jgi:hypothetical protein
MLANALTALSVTLATVTVPATGRMTLPPWPAPRHAITGIRAAGLPLMPENAKLAQHIHAHLDVLVGGRPVKVPAGIGIDRERHGLSPLHTHDASGLLHIESPTPKDFYLGQFFDEWQVAFDRHGIGGLRTGPDNVLEVHVNGRLHRGDPRALRLGAHDEIAVVYGRAGSRVDIPDRFRFPRGM